MTEEELLEAVAEVARQERADALEDPRWEDVSRGEADAATVDELSRRAKAEGVPADIVEAFSPLGANAEDRFVGAILGDAKPSNAEPAPVDTAAPAADGGAAPVISLDAHRRRRRIVTVASAGVVLAAAAAIALAILPRGASVAPVPNYALSVEGGERSVRGEDDRPDSAPVRLRPGSSLELTLRPATPTAGAVAVRLFLQPRDGGALKRWDAPVDVSAQGAARVRAELGKALRLAPGDWRLIVVVGRPDVLPDAAGATRAPASDAEGRWITLERELTVVGE